MLEIHNSSNGKNGAIKYNRTWLYYYSYLSNSLTTAHGVNDAPSNDDLLKQIERQASDFNKRDNKIALAADSAGTKTKIVRAKPSRKKAYLCCRRFQKDCTADAAVSKNNVTPPGILSSSPFHLDHYFHTIKQIQDQHSSGKDARPT